MLYVRCPRCGTITSDQAPDYPLCPGCREDLTRCGYCEYFDAQEGVCVNPRAAGRFRAGPHATPACEEYWPTARLRRPGERWVHPAVWLSALAVFVVAVIIMLGTVFPKAPGRPGSGLLRGPASPPAAVRLQLVLEGPSEVRVGRPVNLGLEAYNWSQQLSQAFQFQLPRDFPRRFRLRQILPEPVRTRSTAKHLELHYPGLYGGGRLRVNLVVVPRVAGPYDLRVRLFSRDNTFHAQGVLPMQVRR